MEAQLAAVWVSFGCTSIYIFLEVEYENVNLYHVGFYFIIVWFNIQKVCVLSTIKFLSSTIFVIKMLHLSFKVNYYNFDSSKKIAESNSHQFQVYFRSTAVSIDYLWKALVYRIQECLKTSIASFPQHKNNSEFRDLEIQNGPAKLQYQKISIHRDIPDFVCIL